MVEKGEELMVVLPYKLYTGDLVDSVFSTISCDKFLRPNPLVRVEEWDGLT